MKRTFTGLLAVALGAIALPLASAGTDLNATTYTAVGLDGHPDLRAGGIVDVTIDRQIGAIEQHRVNGAAADMTYQIVGDIFLFTPCLSDDPIGPIAVPEGFLTTNHSGTGTTHVTFPGGAFDAAPDSFWVRWKLNVDGQTAYRSGCVQVELMGS